MESRESKLGRRLSREEFEALQAAKQQVQGAQSAIGGIGQMRPGFGLLPPAGERRSELSVAGLPPPGTSTESIEGYIKGMYPGRGEETIARLRERVPSRKKDDEPLSATDVMMQVRSIPGASIYDQEKDVSGFVPRLERAVQENAEGKQQRMEARQQELSDQLAAEVAANPELAEFLGQKNGMFTLDRENGTADLSRSNNDKYGEFASEDPSGYKYSYRGGSAPSELNPYGGIEVTGTNRRDVRIYPGDPVLTRTGDQDDTASFRREEEVTLGKLAQELSNEYKTESITRGGLVRLRDKGLFNPLPVAQRDRSLVGHISRLERASNLSEDQISLLGLDPNMRVLNPNSMVRVPVPVFAVTRVDQNTGERVPVIQQETGEPLYRVGEPVNRDLDAIRDELRPFVPSAAGQFSQDEVLRRGSESADRENAANEQARQNKRAALRGRAAEQGGTGSFQDLLKEIVAGGFMESAPVISPEAVDRRIAKLKAGLIARAGEAGPMISQELGENRTLDELIRASSAPRGREVDLFSEEPIDEALLRAHNPLEADEQLGAEIQGLTARGSGLDTSEENIANWADIDYSPESRGYQIEQFDRDPARQPWRETFVDPITGNPYPNPLKNRINALEETAQKLNPLADAAQVDLMTKAMEQEMAYRQRIGAPRSQESMADARTTAQSALNAPASASVAPQEVGQELFARPVRTWTPPKEPDQLLADSIRSKYQRTVPGMREFSYTGLADALGGEVGDPQQEAAMKFLAERIARRR